MPLIWMVGTVSSCWEKSLYPRPSLSLATLLGLPSTLHCDGDFRMWAVFGLLPSGNLTEIQQPHCTLSSLVNTFGHATPESAIEPDSTLIYPGVTPLTATDLLWIHCGVNLPPKPPSGSAIGLVWSRQWKGWIINIFHFPSTVVCGSQRALQAVSVGLVLQRKYQPNIAEEEREPVLHLLWDPIGGTIWVPGLITTKLAPRLLPMIHSMESKRARARTNGTDISIGAWHGEIKLTPFSVHTLYFQLKRVFTAFRIVQHME